MNSTYKTIFYSLLSLATTAWQSTVAIAEEFAFFHENVLGTTLELRVETSTQTIADEAEQIALNEIDRLAEIFSTYSSSSELSKFMAQSPGATMQLSSELSDLLKRSEYWRDASNGAFNPAVQTVTNRWTQAAKTGSMPSRAELVEIVNALQGKHYQCEPAEQTWKRESSLPLTFNAIAKGTIIDLVCKEVLEAIQGVDGVLVNVGGDLRVAGKLSQVVRIADPQHDTLGAATNWQVDLRDAAIATSGVSERQISVGNQTFSHIFDPRTGTPVEHTISSSVVANDAETADVLATICSVLRPQDAVEFVNKFEDAACLVVDKNGEEWTSSRWSSRATRSKAPTMAAFEDKKASPHEFEIKFEIAKSDQGGRYRRPYVAVWVEDSDDFPVKTLSLFMMTDNPGPRWHRDLRRWYAGDQVRLAVDPTKLIGTISKPTRNPGEYKVAWDGRDDSGALLKDGKYTLYIEAAREHGTYQLMKFAFEIGAKDFTEELKGNVEIKTASMTYKKKN